MKYKTSALLLSIALILIGITYHPEQPETFVQPAGWTIQPPQGVSTNEI